MCHLSPGSWVSERPGRGSGAKITPWNSKEPLTVGASGSNGVICLGKRGIRFGNMPSTRARCWLSQLWLLQPSRCPVGITHLRGQAGTGPRASGEGPGPVEGPWASGGPGPVEGAGPWASGRGPGPWASGGGLGPGPVEGPLGQWRAGALGQVLLEGPTLPFPLSPGDLWPPAPRCSGQWPDACAACSVSLTVCLHTCRAYSRLCSQEGPCALPWWVLVSVLK